jgi:hypothetical protein
MMETLLDATTRLRILGFELDFAATADGSLRCPGCDVDHGPERMHVDEIVRYEGASDPDDQSILVALRSDCGSSGLYSAAYGPGTPESDVKALQRLPARRPGYTSS